MAASPISRFFVPVGATFLMQGSIFADGLNTRPHPAAVYAEPSVKDKDLCASAKQSDEQSESKKGLPSCTGPEACCKQQGKKPCAEDTELERLVMMARKSLGPYKDGAMGYAGEGIKQVNVYYDKLMDNICYLRKGAPQEVRVGTIVAGGLTGMLLGIRGGILKKLFMGTLGAGGGAYLAYPYETEKYTKKYTAIAYNFVAGTSK